MGCGSSFSAKAPDDVHKFSSLYQCWDFEWIEREHKCPSCSKKTTLHWHSQVHEYRDYATVEQVNKKMSNGKSDETHGWVKRMAGY
jgi:cytochrome c-type biogenesis protein CcmH/NrfF